MSKIGDRIKKLRMQRNIPQNQFADLIHIPKSTLANYENNHRLPNLKTIHLIASQLGVDPCAIIQGNVPFTTKEIIMYLTNEGYSLEDIALKVSCTAEDLQKMLNKKNESLDDFTEYRIDGMLRSNFNIPKLNEAESDLLAMHKAQSLLGLSYDTMPEIEQTICSKPHNPVSKSASEHKLYSSLENIIDYASSIIGKSIVLDKSEKGQLLEQIVDLIEINIRKKERKNHSK